MSSSLTRAGGFLAIALTLSISACAGGDGRSFGEGEESSGGGSTAPRSTASSASAESSPATPTLPPISPIDVCSVVSAEDVGAVLRTTVEPTPTDSGCTYFYTDGSTGPVIRAQTDTGGVLDTARAASEASLDGVAEPVEVGGNEGYVVVGPKGDSVPGEGAVAVNGLIVSVGLTGAGAEESFTMVEGLLNLIVDSV